MSDTQTDDTITYVDSVHQRSAHGHVHLRSTDECLTREAGELCPSWRERAEKAEAALAADSTARLRAAVAEVEEHLAQIHNPPSLARDTTGRFILLDAYAALVSAEAAREQRAAAEIDLIAAELDLSDYQRDRVHQLRKRRLP